jgi:hypothetical protein
MARHCTYILHKVKNNEKEASSDILSDPIDIGTTRYHYPHEESFFTKKWSE